MNAPNTNVIFENSKIEVIDPSRICVLQCHEKGVSDQLYWDGTPIGNIFQTALDYRYSYWCDKSKSVEDFVILKIERRSDENGNDYCFITFIEKKYVYDGKLYDESINFC